MNKVDMNMKVSMFTNKTLLITGGTGSFGNAVLKRLLDTDISEISESKRRRRSAFPKEPVPPVIVIFLFSNIILDLVSNF